MVAFFVVLGSLFQGQNVMKTIGAGIIKEELNYMAVLVSLVCSGFFVTLATFYRIPISTSQAIVGAVLGIGLFKGAKTINRRTVIRIFFAWLNTPLVAGVLCWGAAVLFL